MKNLNVLRFNLLIVCSLLLFISFLTVEANAERFFQQQNTWYMKIPATPILRAHSSDYVADILYNSSRLLVNADPDWGVPIFHATESTPITTVTVRTSNETIKSWIINNGWNKVPIPSGAVPSGNTAACAGQYRDGHMVIISQDKRWSWDFYQAQHCNGQWSAWSVRKWDLTGSGVIHPYDGHGGQRMLIMPVSSGIVTWNDVQSGVIDHAMGFNYNGQKLDAHMMLYPSVNYVAGISSRPYAMLGGERLQLDPSVDCNSLGLNSVGKMVCVAMQQYGMIFVDNTSIGYNTVGFEDVSAHPGESWSGYGLGYVNIPLDKLRVVEPVCDNCSSICPNCINMQDTIPPAPPKIIGGQ